MRIRVDEVLCVGHGRCYTLAPEVYGEDERGHCRLVTASVPPELAEHARLGARSCPEAAIEIEEDQEELA